VDQVILVFLRELMVRGPSARTFAVTPCTNAISTHPGGDKIATFTVSGTLTVS